MTNLWRSLCLCVIFHVNWGDNFFDLKSDSINKLSFDLNGDFAIVKTAHDYLGVDFAVEVYICTN